MHNIVFLFLLQEAFASDNQMAVLLSIPTGCSDCPYIILYNRPREFKSNLVGKVESVTSTGMYNTFVCA